MNCTLTQEYISQLVDGELNPLLEAEVFSHLSGCESCRAFLKNLLTLTQELVSARIPEVPVSLDQRVQAINYLPPKVSRYISWIQPTRMYSLRAIGLAVLFSVVTTIFVSSFLYKNSQTQQTIVCLTPLPEVEVTGYVVVASSPIKGINQ